LQYACEIAIHIVIPETENAKAGAFERAVAISIARLMTVEIVLTAVDFDDETMLETDEVHDESFSRSLPAEVISASSP
jgi:hypothetical protein